MTDRACCSNQKRFIVDTDPGIDDAMALKLAAASPELDIVAVTTCFGNADIDCTTRNALALCRQFEVRAPVYQGAAQPISMNRRPSPVHVHGVDGLGDAGAISHVATDVPMAERAAEAIVRLVREHPGEIGILALAPLTNLAAALMLAPEIEGLVREVIVMGGAFGQHGRTGNVTPVAEANIWNDPHAAARVFDAAWPITVVGLDVTLDCVLDAAIAERLARESGNDARFLYEISRHYEALYREHDGLDGSCLHDVAAVACAIHPALFTTEAGRILVRTSGATAGQTLFRADSSITGDGPERHGRDHRICVKVDAAHVVALYCDRMQDGHASVLVPDKRSCLG